MLDGFLAYAATDQTTVLAILGGLILLVVVIMAIAVLRANRAAKVAAEAPPPEPAPTTELEVVPETPEEKTAAKREATRSLRRLMREGLGATRESFARNPYLMPWVLRVGIGRPEDDGGLLSALEEIRPAVGDPARGPVSWHFYEHGVIVDVREPDAWTEVLGFCARKRPSLPVDGIILTVPVAALREPRHAASFGAEAYTMLWRAQKQLGFAVPIYVVVTGTEDLPGFRAFEDMLPPGHQDGMVGWSFPYPMETAFTPEYVAEALTAVEQGLLAAALEAFGSVVDPEHGAGMLQVRQDLAELEKPLAGFLATAFRRTAFQESNYFRGLYFITRPDPARPASFARDLIERKVFPENGLSKMLRGAARSRLVQRYGWPAAAGVAVVVGVATVAASVARIEAYEELATPILRATAADVQAATVRRTDETVPGADADAAVRYLRNATTLTESEPLVFVPLTWFVDDPYGVEAAMSAGWRRVALRGVKSQIEARLEALTESGATDVAPDVAFRRYLTRVAEAEGFSIAFNEIGRGGAATGTRQMLEYALGVEVPPATVDKLESWGAIGDDAPPIDDPSLRIDLERFQDAARATFLQLADSYFRMLAAGGQAGVRLQLVAQELNLLAAGARSGLDAADGFAEVEAGLEEASALLVAGRPSWLGADGPIIPADMQLLMDAASVSSLLGPRATRDAMKIAEQRYQEVADRLGAVESVIGPLATRESDASASLTPQAQNLRTVLSRWMERRFMVQASPGQGVTQQAAAGGYGWDAQILESIPPLFEDYLLFEAKEMREVTPELRAAMRSAARASLRTSVDRALQAAATGVNPDVVQSVQSLSQLRQMANSLRLAVPVLEQTVQTYRQIGMAQPADELRAQVADLAAAVIRRVDRMVEEDGLYRANAQYLETWAGDAMSAPGLMGQRDMQALQLHLTRARMEMAVLARETAAPMLEVLSRPLLQTPQAMALAGKWLNVVAALDAYDGQRPNSSLSQLETFILETVPAITDENCLAEPTAPGSADDFFAARLEGIKTAIRDRCIELIDEKLIAAYSAVQGFFDQNLAGKAPFMATRASMGAASPADVRAFYALYDRHGEILSKAVPEAAAVRAEWREPARFLDSMEAARSLLMHVADPQPNARLLIEPIVRVNRDRERGGRHIIEWTLEMGERRLSTFDAEDSVAWFRDEDAAIELRWAKDGPVVPVRALGPAAGPVDGLTARFEAAGPWALHSLVRALRAPARDRSDDAPQDAPILRLEVVTADIGTPDQRRAPETAARVAAAEAEAERVEDDPESAPTPLAEGLARVGRDTAEPEPLDPDQVARVYMALSLERLTEREGAPVTEPVPFPELPGRAPPVPSVGYAVSRAEAGAVAPASGLFGGLPTYPGGLPAAGAAAGNAAIDQQVFGLPAASDLFTPPMQR